MCHTHLTFLPWVDLELIFVFFVSYFKYDLNDWLLKWHHKLWQIYLKLHLVLDLLPFAVCRLPYMQQQQKYILWFIFFFFLISFWQNIHQAHTRMSFEWISYLSPACAVCRVRCDIIYNKKWKIQKKLFTSTFKSQRTFNQID